MKRIKLAKTILKTLTKDRIRYPGKLFADMSTTISRCGILLILYWYVFKLNNGAINGTTFLFVSWSIFLYFSLSLLRLRDITRLIMQDIQTGNIEILLSKPISYLSYRVWWQIGSTLYSFVIISILATVALFLIVGFPPTMLAILFVPTLFITFILSIILSLLIYIIIGLLSFWIEDVIPVLWMVDKSIMILGGSYLPIAFFPDLMKKIALYSPLGASQFVTHTVGIEWQTTWYKLLTIQSLWILILGFVIYLMFKKAVKKVSINGG